jgi:hypothetical protein
MILRGIAGFCGGSVSVSGQARVETKVRGIRSTEPLKTRIAAMTGFMLSAAVIVAIIAG